MDLSSWRAVASVEYSTRKARRREARQGPRKRRNSSNVIETLGTLSSTKRAPFESNAHTGTAQSKKAIFHTFPEQYPDEERQSGLLQGRSCPSPANAFQTSRRNTMRSKHPTASLEHRPGQRTNMEEKKPAASHLQHDTTKLSSWMSML